MKKIDEIKQRRIEKCKKKLSKTIREKKWRKSDK